MLREPETLGPPWIGIVLAVVGNLVLAIGFVLQKHAHERHKLTPLRRESPDTFDSAVDASETSTANSNDSVQVAKKVAQDLYFLRSRGWWLGLGLVAVGEVLNGLALAFASGSKIPAVGALALVVIAALSFAVLGEHPSLLNWVGIGLASLGVAFIGVWAPIGNFSQATLTPQQASTLVLDTPFVVLSIVYGFVGLVLILVAWIRPGFAGSHVLVFSSLAALAGSFKQRSIKIGLQLFSEQIMDDMRGASIWGSAVFWLAVIVATTSTLLSLYLLNKAISAFPRQSLPVFFSLFVLLSVFSSNALYNEYSGNTFNIAGFASGMTFVTIGCVLYSVPVTTLAAQETRTDRS